MSSGVGRMSRILIVDDEPFNVDLLEQELEDLGDETASARNGQEALERVAADPPDLILLDVMMPVLDGLAVCRELKGRDDTRLIPIVIMTALDGVEDRIKGIEAGADDFLTKPVNPRELRARIQTALRLKHAVDRKLGELRRIKDHLAKFVPDAVRRLVLVNPDAPKLAKPGSCLVVNARTQEVFLLVRHGEQDAVDRPQATRKVQTGRGVPRLHARRTPGTSSR